MKLLALVAAALCSVTFASDAVPTVPVINFITYEDVLAVRASDEENEFGALDSENAAALYEASLRHDWAQAVASTEEYPFLVCRNTTIEETGNEIRARLQTVAGEGSTVKTVVNDDGLYCAIGRFSSDTAIAGSDLGWKIQPLGPALKLLAGSLADIEKAIEDLEKIQDVEEKDFPSVDVVLCPGVTADAPVGDNTAALLTDQTGTGAPPTFVERFAWWRAARQDDEVKGILESSTSPREEFWEEVLFEAADTGKCDDTFQNRLIWTPIPSADGEAESGGNLQFDNSGADRTDKLCALAVVAALAVQTEVCTIQSRKQVKTSSNNPQWLVQTGIKNERPWFDAGLTGAGQVVAVSDTGVDPDNCYFQDGGTSVPYDSRNDNHRKIVEYKTFVDDIDYIYGHGTHVVGSIVGDQAAGEGIAQGVAPGAKTAFIDIGDSQGSLYTPANDDILLGTGRTGTPKAQIHSASWGVPNLNTYTVQAANFDDFMYQAEKNGEDFLIFVAAGNGGGGNTFSSVGSPATAKNIMTVGASHSYGSDLQKNQLGPNHVADFSSRGPTGDGRTKPEILAPGKWVLSAGALPNVNGECDAGDPGAGGESGGVLSLQGTSMATPIAAGHAALIRQYFLDGFYPTGAKVAANSLTPSGALIKAVLINGAQYLAGVDNGPGKSVAGVSPYDNIQNFGRISLKDSLYLVGKSNVQAEVWDRQQVLNGQTQPYSVTIDMSNGCTTPIMSTSLVWFERGSIPGCFSCLLNDLDLYVTKGESSTRYYPNGRTDRDNINTSERVQIEDVKDGDMFNIHVQATNLDQDSQTFALVATGCFGGVATTLDESKDAFATDDSESSRKNKMIGIICGIVGGVLLIGIGVYCYMKRPLKNRKKKQSAKEVSAESDAGGLGLDEVPKSGSGTQQA